ncbi:MAG: hypothetical protein M3O30_18350 [Planctomycetota bacterium]|nr:hypothetical protein [Planctomycetota bacterium]
MVHESEFQTRVRECIRELLMPAAGPRAAMRAKLRQARDIFYDEMIRTVEKPLLDELQGLPQANFSSKKELSYWLSAELTRLGLAIRCPRTDIPARLVAVPDAGRADGGIGTFAFEVMDAKGRAKLTARGRRTLPELTLTRDEKLDRLPPGYNYTLSSSPAR